MAIVFGNVTADIRALYTLSPTAAFDTVHWRHTEGVVNNKQIRGVVDGWHQVMSDGDYEDVCILLRLIETNPRISSELNIEQIKRLVDKCLDLIPKDESPSNGFNKALNGFKAHLPGLILARPDMSLDTIGYWLTPYCETSDTRICQLRWDTLVRAISRAIGAREDFTYKHVFEYVREGYKSGATKASRPPIYWYAFLSMYVLSLKLKQQYATMTNNT